MSRREADAKIADRIEKARPVRDGLARNTPNAEPEFDRWNQYNLDFLERLFTDASIADEYRSAGMPSTIVVSRGEGPGERARRLADRVDARVNYLVSLRERLELFEEPAQAVATPAVVSRSATATAPRRAAFVVHGHDNAAREATARVLQQLDVEPIILHEQANRGQTIIEKFERHSDVPFAVVLLTPDDVGRANDETDLQPRARQNVWFELGFFAGKLGRDHVCALHKGPLEIPSDIKGVIYTPMDEAGAWRYQLANELHAAGIAIDLNRLRRS